MSGRRGAARDGTAVPDSTAERVALWRALHVQVDSAPHVFEDEIGLKLAASPDDWRRRPDMDPVFTRPFRASIVARSRFIEDLVLEEVARGVSQYVLLGSGLDTFAQRRPGIAARMRVFEVDRPDAQRWKHQRLVELGFGVPECDPRDDVPAAPRAHGARRPLRLPARGKGSEGERNAVRQFLLTI